MADQKVQLKIGADTSDLERAFGALIKKIQSDADKIKLSPASASSRGAVQTARDQERNLTREKAILDAYNRSLESRKKVLEEISKLEAKGVDQTRQRQMAEERLDRSRRVAQIQQANYDRLQDTARRSMGAGGSGGPSNMPKGGITSLSGLAGAIGVPGMAIGGLATLMAGTAAAESTRRFFAEASNRARVAQATAFNVQGQGGQRLQSFVNGGAPEEFMFNSQRIQAAKTAEDTVKERYNLTAFGASPMAMAVSALRHPLMNTMRLGGALGFTGLGQEYEGRKNTEQANYQSEQFEALKNGPEGKLRTVVADKYLRDFQRNLDFQRQMGQTEGGFRGFLGGANNAGFTDEMAMGMGSGIMGAGGSTRSATGNATLGLQAQRNLDITNAGSILGKLSGGLGSAETSKEAFVKLLAEGTRVGLDGSDFREENRKFVESAAQAISQSGTTTTGGVDQILSQFGRFFGDRTMAGQEAGKGAYELYRQTSMASTGPTGTMRAAGMMSDPTISKLSTFSRASLFNMPIDQLTPDNPAIIAMAAEAHTTPQKLIDAQNGITAASANKFQGSDAATKNLENIKKKYGVRSAIGYQGPLSPAAYTEMQMALGQSNIFQGVEHPELAQNQRMASAYSDALSSGDVQKQNKALEDAKNAQLAAGGTGRLGDETNRQQAEASRMANELFTTIQKSIVPASEATQQFAKDINALTAAMKGGDTAKIAAAIQSMQGHGNGAALGPSTPPTAGSPPSGSGH